MKRRWIVESANGYLCVREWATINGFWSTLYSRTHRHHVAIFATRDDALAAARWVDPGGPWTVRQTRMRT